MLPKSRPEARISSRPRAVTSPVTRPSTTTCVPVTCAFTTADSPIVSASWADLALDVALDAHRPLEDELAGDQASRAEERIRARVRRCRRLGTRRTEFAETAERRHHLVATTARPLAPLCILPEERNDLLRRRRQHRWPRQWSCGTEAKTGRLYHRPPRAVNAAGRGIRTGAKAALSRSRRAGGRG